MIGALTPKGEAMEIALLGLTEPMRRGLLNLAQLKPNEWAQRRRLNKHTVRALLMRGLLSAKDVGLVPCMRLSPRGEAVARMIVGPSDRGEGR